MFGELNRSDKLICYCSMGFWSRSRGILKHHGARTLSILGAGVGLQHSTRDCATVSGPAPSDQANENHMQVSPLLMYLAGVDVEHSCCAISPN